MQSYRVTKYDPKERNGHGAYVVEDWISSSNIGDSINGQVLTLDNYLQCENNYVRCIKQLLSLAEISDLKVASLEDYREDSGTEYNSTFGDTNYNLRFKEGQVIRGELISSIIRLALREELWCKLECPNGFIHFGHDFYCYVGIPIAIDIGTVEIPGIFIEKFESPYL